LPLAHSPQALKKRRDTSKGLRVKDFRGTSQKICLGYLLFINGPLIFVELSLNPQKDNNIKKIITLKNRKNYSQV